MINVWVYVQLFQHDHYHNSVWEYDTNFLLVIFLELTYHLLQSFIECDIKIKFKKFIDDTISVI